jgi:hypothetical protein
MLGRLRGRPLFLVFWKSWSVPCLTELNQLAALLGGPSNRVVLAINGVKAALRDRGRSSPRGRGCGFARSGSRVGHQIRRVVLADDDFGSSRRGRGLDPIWIGRRSAVRGNRSAFNNTKRMKAR